MEHLNTVLLIVHIVSGYFSLTIGSLVLFFKKGGQRHRMLGRVFFISMLGVSATSVYLSYQKNIPFLFFIGIFVLFLNYSGYRSVKNKSLKPNWLDVIFLLIGLVNGLWMIVTLNIVLVVFGGISCLLVFLDLRTYYFLYKKKNLQKMAWLKRHIGMMMGAYIGALTAFLVVNIKFIEPFWLVWLVPTIVLVPLMQYWTWKYTTKPYLKKR